MIGDSNEDVYRVKAEVDFTDIEELKSLLEDLKKKFADLNRLSTPPALRSKRDDVAKQIVETERLIAAQDKAAQSAQRLARTQDSLRSKNLTPFDKSWTKPLGVTPPPIITGADEVRKIGQEAIRTRQYLAKMNKELEAQKDIIEDIAKSPPGEGEIGVTRKQRELIDAFRNKFTLAAQSLSVNRPGERAGQTEAAVKKMQERIVDKYAAPPGRYVGSVWKSGILSSTDFTSAVDTVGQKINEYLSEGIKKGIIQKSDTIKSRVARSTSGLYPEDYLRGRSDADMGIETPLRKEMNLTTGVPSRIPAGKAGPDLADRMWLFVRDVRQNFKEAGNLVQELYITGDQETKQKLDAIAALNYGTDVYDEAKKSFTKLPARVSKEGVTYKKELGENLGIPHPIAALYSLRDFFEQMQEQRVIKTGPQSLMPNKRIQEVRDVLVGEKKFSDIKTPVPADVIAAINKATPTEMDVHKGEALDTYRDLRDSITRFQEGIVRRKVVPGAQLRRVNEATKAIEAYGQEISIIKERPEGDPRQMWDEFRQLSRSVRELRRVMGAQVDPMRKRLTETARDMVAGMSKQSLGLGKYFDPLRLMDPAYMANKKTGWMGRLGTGNAFRDEADLHERGLAPQKFNENLGFLKNIDVEGFNKIPSMVKLYRGEAVPHSGEFAGKESPYMGGVQTGAWFADTIEQAKKHAEDLAKEQPGKIPIVKSVVVPNPEQYKNRVGYGIPPEIAEKAVDITEQVAPATKKMSESVTGIVTSGMVASIKKAADQAAEITRTTEVPEQVGPVPPGMGAPGPTGSPIETQVNKAMIPIQMVGDKIIQVMGNVRREIEVVPGPEMIPGAAHPHGPLGNVPAKMMGAEIPIEVHEGEMALPAVAISRDIAEAKEYWKEKKKKKEWPSVGEIIAKSGAMGEAEPGKETEFREKVGFWTKTLAAALPPTEKLRDFVNRVYKEGNAAPENSTVLAYANHLNDLFEKNVLGKGPAPSVGRPKTEIPGMNLPNVKPDFFQRMFGTEYKIKLSFTDFEEFKTAQEIMSQMPGFVRMTTKEYEQYGGAAEDVLHTVEMTGKIKSEEDIEKVRYGTKYLSGGKSAVQDRSILQIDQQRVNLGQRLFQMGQLSDKLNWKLVRGQMALLGIAFSMQGAVRMVQSAWSMLGNQMSKLQTVFENIAMAMAFGPKSAQGFLRGMLGDSKNIVGAWKTYTGLMATINSMLAFMAYKIFSDKRVIDSIQRVVEKLVDKLSDPAFVDRIVNLVAMIIDNLPSIIDGVLWIAELLMGIAASPGMGEVLKWMVLMGIAAQFLMTPLALLGGAFQLLSWILEGLGVTLATTFGKGWIIAALTGLVDFITGSFAGALALGATTLALSIGTGFLAGMLVVRVLVEQGITGWLASVGDLFRKGAPWLMDALSVFLWPLGMLGTMVLDIVTFQFDKILPDMAAVFLKAVKAASEMLEAAFRLLPYGLGTSIAVTFQGSQDQLQGMINNLTAQGGATHRIASSAPKLASGGYIEQTGLAVVHKGETVVPEGQSGNVTITNYNSVQVNNKVDEKYLENMLGRKYYGSY